MAPDEKTARWLRTVGMCVRAVPCCLYLIEPSVKGSVPGATLRCLASSSALSGSGRLIKGPSLFRIDSSGVLCCIGKCLRRSSGQLTRQPHSARGALTAKVSRRVLHTPSEEEERSLIEDLKRHTLGGGGEECTRRSEEAHPTHCRVEPARVSSPQVDLTRYVLDKTPTLLILPSSRTCSGHPHLRREGVLTQQAGRPRGIALIF